MRTWWAVVLEVVFVFFAFGVRSWVQWRRTGATGLVLPRWDAPAVERLGGGLFVAAVVLLVVAPVVDLGDGGRIGLLDNAVVAVIGAVLALAGIVLCLAAQLSMGDSWRIGVDPSARTELVTGGLFAQVRNPIFSAMVLATAGFALLVPNVWALLAFLALIAALELQVRFVEEPYLRSVHGEAYDRYASRAGRFVPGVGVRHRMGQA